MPLSVPKFLTKAFAAAGGKADVPMTGADINNGRADYDNGFPPVTRTPIAAGGIPPYGVDMNGVLFDLSSGLRYLQAGMVFPYSQDLANAIGGYDVGALVTASGIRYVSTISGNSLPPPSAGWQAFSFSDPSETLRGMPLVATSTEAAALTNVSKIITPMGLKNAFLNNANVASTGYQKLPSGLIIQWGVTTTPANNVAVVVNLPIAWPNFILSGVANPSGPASNAGVFGLRATGDTSKTQISITQGGTSPQGTFWIALGA